MPNRIAYVKQRHARHALRLYTSASTSGLDRLFTD